MIENIFFFAKIALGEALFPPSVKAKNQHKIFEKHLKQKRCAIRRLNVQIFCHYKKNTGYHGEKRRKLFKIVDYLTYVENCVFLAVFYCKSFLFQVFFIIL